MIHKGERNMKWLDRIKQFFNRKNKVETLPEAQSNYIVENKMILNRADGTTIEISPALDRTGNQLYEQVFNDATQQIQYIPKFNIYSEELRSLVDSNILQHTILMDINPEILKNQYYADYIANQMLSQERMKKVVGEYENYAGGISFDENGAVTGRYVDKGIIRTLNATKEERNRMMTEARLKKDEEYKREVMEKAQNTSLNIKESHAEDLSQGR